jgi:hypothetical protein
MISDRKERGSDAALFLVSRACSTAWRCKSSTQLDGSEGLAKRKGEITLAARRGLRHKNASGADIYVGMNSLKRDAQSRTKEDVDTIRHLYLDIDRRGPEAVGAIENSGLVPRPNYVLVTSPGKFQVIWKVEDIPQDRAEALQRAMVREFGGDPAATDSTRVLRWPTFANRKYEHEHIVKARAEATDTYHLEDFRLRTELQDEWREHAVSRESRQTRTGGEVTQSERDWAFAKRALGRGDDPEQVVRRIADYRGDDKHSNYARYTVEKAQMELQRGAASAQSIERSPTRTGELSHEQ